MKTAVFFTSYPISHIQPLEGLIENLMENDYSVYALSGKENKNILESYGAIFIEYPFDFRDTCHEDAVKHYIKKCVEYSNNGDYLQAYQEYLKSDIASVMNVDENRLNLIRHIIKKMKPDVIFRDAVDHYGKIIGSEMHIKTVGYMTNNMYSVKFLNQNPEHLCKIFMNGFSNEEQIGKEFYKNFIQTELRLYKEVEKELNAIHIQPLNQFNLDEEFNIIFSLDELQPKTAFFVDKKYIIMKPDNKYYMHEKNIDTDIVDFFETDKKVIYIATGSIVTRELDYYRNILKELSEQNIKVIISGGDKTRDLQTYVKNERLENKVLIKSYLPQKYILSKASLFITSGGFNSILEAIYYECPMLVLPIASEQGLNGYIISKKGLGETVRSEENINKSLSELVHIVMQKKLIKNNLRRVSKNMKKNSNSYTELHGYLNG